MSADDADRTFAQVSPTLHETVVVETTNDHLVGMQAGRVVIVLPPTEPMGTEEALRLAAWLVALADFGGERFPAVLEAVRRT